MAKCPVAPLALLLLVAASLGGCGSLSGFGPTASLSDRECLARVMYFESNRSSDEGMLAVGTVVMNRVQSPKYPKSVCEVIGQKSQFAPGALTNPVSRRSTSWARAERAADAVLSGERHDKVGSAMFFHTQGYTFPYKNMHYVALAGGNAFYEKRRIDPSAPASFQPAATMLAAYRPTFTPRPVAVAALEEPRPEPVRPRPTVVARAEIDEDAADDAPAEPIRPAHRPVAADTPATRPRPQPVVTAEAAPSHPRATILAVAGSRPLLPGPSVPRAGLAGQAATPGRAATALPAPLPPRPIVLAMRGEPRPPARPRNIADLIAMDLEQR